MSDPRIDLQLMELQVRTLFTHDEAGRLRLVPKPSERPAPRFFLGRTAGGNVWRLRHDLPDDVAAELARLASSEPVTADVSGRPAHYEAYREVLRSGADVQHEFVGPAYRFPDHVRRPSRPVMVTDENASLLRTGFADLIQELPHRQPCLAIVEGGRAVSICCCARITGEAAEAGVETEEAFRGRGHATEAVAAWALAIRDRGLMPLYSTSWDNLASQGVARKLGLTMYGADFHLT